MYSIVSNPGHDGLAAAWVIVPVENSGKNVLVSVNVGCRTPAVALKFIKDEANPFLERIQKVIKIKIQIQIRINL